MARSSLVVLLSLSCWTASIAAAQESYWLSAGATIRLRASGHVDVSGEITNLTRDSLIIDAAGHGRVAVPLTALESLEVRRGRGSIFNGAQRGFFIGVAAGFALTAVSAVLAAEEGIDVRRGTYLLGIPIGAGVLLGSFALRGSRWRSLPLPR